MKQNNHSTKKVLLALSGGVDSCVAAALLKSQGYDVSALFLKLWCGDVAVPVCASGGDLNAAQAFCSKLEIPLIVEDVKDVFNDIVVDYFVHEHLQQRKAAVCARCSVDVKFKTLAKKADELGFNKIATGHYAQALPDSALGIYRLCKAVDAEHDQSCLLYGLPQNLLKRTLMPLGGITHGMVLKVAQQFDLTGNNTETAALCFVRADNIQEFLDKRSPSVLRPKGIIRTIDGHVLGEHNGLHRYSLGQIFEPLVAAQDKKTFYVVDFDPSRQVLIVGSREHLFSDQLIATQVRWVRPVHGLHSLKCGAQVKRGSAAALCSVTLFENETVHIKFNEKQWGVTPGDSVVFYDNDDIIGGAIIDRVGTPPW